MNIGVLVVVTLAIAVHGMGILYRRHRAKPFADVSDEEFLRRFSLAYSAPAETVLKERRRIAKMFAIPQEKLSPEQSLSELAKNFEYLGDFSVAWTDLDDEVSEARIAAGLAERAEHPLTIGHLIAELLAPEP